MAVSHWWFSCLIDHAEFQLLEPAFRHAEELAALSPAHRRAFDLWRSAPDCFDAYGSKLAPESRHLINDFIAGFNLPGFDDLARGVCRDGGEFGTLLAEEKCFRFCMMDRCTPVAALFRALGHERAAALPGLYGNLLLNRAAIEPALSRVQQAYADSNVDELVEDAAPFLEEHQRSDLVQVVTHLPEALREARARGTGLLALGCMEL